VIAVIDVVMVPERPEREPVPVALSDCPTCLSAGSVRRGVCDICGTEAGERDLVPA
jgi:hypothetical protein